MDEGRQMASVPVKDWQQQLLTKHHSADQLL